MGVLDARYKAENVGYSFIGEKAKEDSNVIDYNINEEITKDTSAVFNANNDTTTGMATVIPGVNAPKLIEDTSIISAGTEFCEISIGITGTMLSGEFSYFDNLSVTKGCSSIKLDDNKRDIWFAAGIYIVYVFLTVHRGIATFMFSGHYRPPSGVFERFMAEEDGTGAGYNMYCGILKAGGGGYVKYGIRPTENITNVQDSFIRIAKIG